MDSKRTAHGWLALMLGAAMLSMGCATATPAAGRRTLPVEARQEGPRSPGRTGEQVQITNVSLAGPAEMSMRASAGGLQQADAFEALLLLAGLNEARDPALREGPLTPQEATRLLSVLLQKPVTRGSFPPRMAVCHLLREVMEGGEVSREELPRRVDRFKTVAVLRPDGYLAWTLTGRTQQKVGPVEWKEESFRAGSFELGRFYAVSGWVFRRTDSRLRPLLDGPPLAEVYDDADLIGRSLDGAQEALVGLYHAVGQLLTHPLDSVAALRHLPAGVAALIASSPEFLDRFRFMTRGEQIQTVSRLTTQLLVTFGTAGGVTSTLTRAASGLEASVPMLSLSADGLLTAERIIVPVGKTATVLSGGPGAAIILQMANAGEHPPQQGYPKDYVSERTQNHSANYASEGEARAVARQKVGNGPVAIEPGKLRSQDGKWQYRAKPEDLQGHRPGDTPHIHIERLDPRTGEVLENWHLRW